MKQGVKFLSTNVSLLRVFGYNLVRSHHIQDLASIGPRFVKKHLLKLYKADRKPTSKLKRVSKCSEIFRKKNYFPKFGKCLKKETNFPQRRYSLFKCRKFIISIQGKNHWAPLTKTLVNCLTRSGEPHVLWPVGLKFVPGKNKGLGPGLEDLCRRIRSQGHLLSLLLGEGAI